MLQAKGAHLVNEGPQVFAARQADVEHFDRCQALGLHMFTQVDISEAASTQPTPQPIVTKALTDPVCPFCHLILSFSSQEEAIQSQCIRSTCLSVVFDCRSKESRKPSVIGVK